jgi:PAS domain-containing protein
MVEGASGSKSLPLILARELASNLSTPMFLVDAVGTLVYLNDAAELFVGRTLAEIGEITGVEFGEQLQLQTADGTPMRPHDSPAGIAFFQRRPAHKVVLATCFDGETRVVNATAYPLFGVQNELHGVVTVFWPPDERNGKA